MRRRKTEIRVEIERVLIIKLNRQPRLEWCPLCAAEVSMVTPEEAAMLTGQSYRWLCRQVEAGQLHFTETADGLLRLCLNSLPNSI